MAHIVYENSNVEDKERIDYVFKSFQVEFPSVQYDERVTILGIGEPNKYLMAYFKMSDQNEVLVKFKSNSEPIPLRTSIEEIDANIAETILYFRSNPCQKQPKRNTSRNNRSLQSRYKTYLDILHAKSRPSYVEKCQENEDARKFLESIEYNEEHFAAGTTGRALCVKHKNGPDVQPYFVNDSTLMIKNLRDNQDLLEDFTRKTELAICELADAFIIEERDKDVIKTLIMSRRGGSFVKDLAEKYSLSRTSIYNIYNKELKKIGRRLFMQKDWCLRLMPKKNEFFAGLSTIGVDAYILYLRISKLLRMQTAVNNVFLHKRKIHAECTAEMSKAEAIIVSNEKIRNAKVKEYVVNHIDEFINNPTPVVDNELLALLDAERINVANSIGAKPEWIYSINQLSALAKVKPTTKERYCEILGSEVGWEEYGQAMTEIIKEYVESKKPR